MPALSLAPSHLAGLRPAVVSLAILAALALTGCGDDDAPPGPDAATPDGGGHEPDAGPSIDAGPADAGPPDAGPLDAGPPDAGPLDPAPLFRNPVALPDAELAVAALRVMGATEAGGSGQSCRSCHALSRARIRQWYSLSDFAWRTCLADLEVRTVESAAAVVECLREGTQYQADRLGVFSSAARLEWFPFVFDRALGAGGATAYAQFTEQAGMPYEPETHPSLTQEQFDLVAEWFIRGVPQLDAVLPEDVEPTACRPSIFPEVAAHVADMSANGWAAVNRGNMLLMYGCAGAASPLECLASKPRASETAFGALWETPAGTHQRVLYTYAVRSSYWTRSSADGRFVAHGRGASGASSTFIDLQENRLIGADASYDPSFFPDNTGFVFQGGGAHFCEQSVLFTGMPTRITFAEPQCETNNVVGLYEHVGASLAGSDYWAVHGDFVSDDATRSADPDASFPASSTIELTRLVNDGTGFSPRETLEAITPYEGDAVISPSSQLMVTRLGASGRQYGYVLRRIRAQRDAGGTWSVAVPEIGRYCINGGKPAISFDERWMVIHHYESDRSNVWLVDLLDGTQTRITEMQRGQYALFPHFRSDGWIYFLVRDVGTNEHIVASDAAIVLSR